MFSLVLMANSDLLHTNRFGVNSFDICRVSSFSMQ